MNANRRELLPEKEAFQIVDAAMEVLSEPA